MKFLEKTNTITTNQLKAYGIPTSYGIIGGNGIVDLTIYNKNKAHKIKNTIINDIYLEDILSKKSHSRHATILNHFDIPMQKTTRDTEIKYTLNTNSSDMKCLIAFQNRICKIIHNQIQAHMINELTLHQQDKQIQEEITATFQNITTIIHQLTALNIFWIKKITTNQHPKHNNQVYSQKLSQLKGDYADEICKQNTDQHKLRNITKQIQEEIEHLHQERNDKLFTKNSDKHINKIYKKYKNMAFKQAAPVPEQMTNDNNQLINSETQYANYIQQLMSPIQKNTSNSNTNNTSNNNTNNTTNKPENTQKQLTQTEQIQTDFIPSDFYIIPKFEPRYKYEDPKYFQYLLYINPPKVIPRPKNKITSYMETTKNIYRNTYVQDDEIEPEMEPPQPIELINIKNIVESIQPDPYNLTYHEKYDSVCLDTLIKMGPHTFAHTISTITNKPAEKYLKLYKQLQIYQNRSKNRGAINIKYHYGQYDHNKKGRIYANDNIGLQKFSRIVRGALTHKNYYDIDIENAHPTILYHLCKQLQINCPELEKYVTNRDYYLTQLCMFNNITQKTAKKTYIAIMNGGTKMYDNIWFKPIHIKNYKKELRAIANRLRAYFPTTLKEVKEKPRDSEKYSETGSFISTICCRIENAILQTAIKYTQNAIIGIGNNIIPCFDGFMPPQAAFNYNKTTRNNFISRLQKHINIKYQLNLKWHPKDLNTTLYNLLKKSKKQQKQALQNNLNQHDIRQFAQETDKQQYLQNNNTNNTNTQTINQHQNNPNQNITQIQQYQNNPNQNKTSPPQCDCNKNNCIHHQLWKTNNTSHNNPNTNHNKTINNPPPVTPHNIIRELKKLTKPYHISIINKERIEQTIQKLQENNGSPGIDFLPIEYFFWSGSAMIDILHDYYKILETINIIPHNLKTDIKTPLPKYKKDAKDNIKQDPSQYRPVALQSLMYKILDGNLKIELEEHNLAHNIIEPNQGGFKQKEGTNEHTYVLQNIFCHNKKIYSAFLDLKKAYDTVWREAMYEELQKECKMPSHTISFIKAMYKNTTSIIKVNNKLSKPVQTHKGLVQGGLSSPILFNFFINDLIKQLNETKIGTNIGNLKISSLFFADDIYINATNIKDLKILLDICAKWASKLHLTFSPSKSELLTNQPEKLSPIPFQTSQIEHAKKGYYKYLGIPIYQKGVDKETYLQKQRAKFFIKRNIMKHFSTQHQLNIHHRVQIYKAIIRSQFDYGAHILNYKETDIQKLENYQHQTLIHLLGLNPQIHYRTLIYALHIPTIKERIHKAKANFFFKLKKSDNQNSMAKKVFQILQPNPFQYRNYFDYTPTENYIQTLKHYNLDPLIQNNTNMTTQQIEKYVEKNITLQNLEETRRIIKYKQFHQTYKDKDGQSSNKPMHPDMISPLLNRLKIQKQCTMKTDKNYINNKYSHYSKAFINTISECDNNAAWYSTYTNCNQCRKNASLRPTLHKIFNCTSTKIKRKSIINSILTELENYYTTQTNKHKPLTSTEKLNCIEMNLLKAPLNNTISPESQLNYINILLGNTIKPNNPHGTKLETILNSHLILLTKIIEPIQDSLQNYTKLPNTNDLYHKLDIQTGMIIVRTYKNGQIIYKNIREQINNMTIPDMEKYNVGLGTASSRTETQKKMAQQYTDKIFAKIQGTFITTDASICETNNKGGIGIISIDKKHNKTLYEYSEQINTTDAQYGEIQGIKQSLILIKQQNIPHRQKISIICDCKNAIKIIKHHIKCPNQYKQIIQEIHELIYHINTIMGIKTPLYWIPGHTDNQYNDRVDALAKQAARSETANYKLFSTSQLRCPLLEKDPRSSSSPEEQRMYIT